MGKSETSKILSKRLELLTEERRDLDYKLSNKDQAEEMGIPYPTFNKYLHDSAECGIFYLNIIANYYGVSTDYLLGRSDLKSPNNKDIYINKHTGLTDGALITIQQALNEQNNGGLPVLDVLNAILDNDDFAMIIECFAELKNLYLTAHEKRGIEYEYPIMILLEEFRRSMIEQLTGMDYNKQRTEYKQARFKLDMLSKDQREKDNDLFKSYGDNIEIAWTDNDIKDG